MARGCGHTPSSTSSTIVDTRPTSSIWYRGHSWQWELIPAGTEIASACQRQAQFRTRCYCWTYIVVTKTGSSGSIVDLTRSYPQLLLPKLSQSDEVCSNDGTQGAQLPAKAAQNTLCLSVALPLSSRTLISTNLSTRVGLANASRVSVFALYQKFSENIS